MQVPQLQLVRPAMLAHSAGGEGDCGDGGGDGGEGDGGGGEGAGGGGDGEVG